ncbi:MAG TPA: hypothetical protein VGJ73_01925 [Verrucomicrobiae bacterium]
MTRSGCLLLVAAATGMALFVPVQTIAQQGQPILFSTPDSGEASTNVPSLTPQPPELPAGINADSDSSFYQPPVPNVMPQQPLPSPRDIANMQKQLDDKENWALLTPAEILGVPTPEKMMGLPERGANGLTGNETAAERFIERQQIVPTNGMVNLTQWGLPVGDSNSAATTVAIFGSVEPTANSFFSQILGTMQPGQIQNPNTPNPVFGFGSPPPVVTTTPTPEQIAENEAFQKLIAPHSAPPSGGTWSGEYPPRSQSGVAPLFATPQATPQTYPIGESFTPLTNGIHIPEGTRPLPGLFQTEKTPAVSEWKPQMPPWMSSAPQPGEIPQSKILSPP